MSDVTKFLKDDHARLRRAIAEYQRTPNNLMAAMNVCDVLAIHLKIERDLIYPAMWESLTDQQESVVGGADDTLYQRMEAVENLQPDDPTVSQKMIALSRAVSDHVAASLNYVEPKLLGRPDGMEMGAEAFRRWQEAFEQQMPRTWQPMNRLANTGWGGGGGGSVGNTGW